MGELRSLPDPLASEDAPKRGGIAPKLRFEVFKRDDFTCQYCGRKTPSVVLEADHILPVASAGRATMENLVTSCWECNRGKGKALLHDRNAVIDYHEQAVLALERQLQREEYEGVLARVRAAEDRDITVLLGFWNELWGGGTSRCQPYRPALRAWLHVCTKYELMDFMEQASDRMDTDRKAVHYLAGIMRRIQEERLGRRAD